MSWLPPDVVAEVERGYGAYYERLSRVPAAKLAADVLSLRKPHDQLDLLARSAGLAPGALAGRRLLEVGSGFGVLVAVAVRERGIDARGVEPAAPGFDDTLRLARRVLAAAGAGPARVLAGAGEDLPFRDASFDLVFSSTVLEHTRDPERVLREGVRVLRPGGHLQFVFPNYGGFFEGHYAVPWIPYLGRRGGRAWLRLLGRDPSYIDTIQRLNWFRVRRWVARLTGVEVVTWGDEVFRRRMAELDVAGWAGLGRVRRWVELAHRLRLVGAATRLLVAIRAFEPIVLTLAKRGA